MATKDLVFVGIKGAVVAMDTKTGARNWEKKLKGSDFVSVLIDGDRVLAGTQGEIFCLDAKTGEMLWHDGLKGYGLGLMNIATRNGSSDTSLAQARQQQDSNSADSGGVYCC
jgi:outer membrane protein assembly factor BamB